MEIGETDHVGRRERVYLAIPRRGGALVCLDRWFTVADDMCLCGYQGGCLGRVLMTAGWGLER